MMGATLERAESDFQAVTVSRTNSRTLNSGMTNSGETVDEAMISPGERVERGRGELNRGELPCLYNRVREIAWHIPWYGFKTQARLSQDSGVSPAAISRLIRGHSQPTVFIALRVTAALSRRLGHPLDVREVFSLDASFPTPSVCHLTGCRNCLPPAAYDSDEMVRSEYAGVKAGGWSLATRNHQGGR